MPLTGEAGRTYQREYKRKQRASMRQAAEAIIRSVVPTNGRPSLLTQQAREVGQSVVREALEKSNLGLRRITDKVSERLDSSRPYAVTEEAGGRKVTISAPDNDAQLRAAELGIRLHERAGTIPAGPQPQAVTTRTRMVQVSPDGTEQAIEIVT
jgi:hypothetical protein